MSRLEVKLFIDLNSGWGCGGGGLKKRGVSWFYITYCKTFVKRILVEYTRYELIYAVVYTSTNFVNSSLPLPPLF